MASLRGARHISAPTWRLPAGCSTKPFHTCVRPGLANNTQRFTQHKIGTRRLHIQTVESCIQLAQDHMVSLHLAGLDWLTAIFGLALIPAALRVPLTIYSTRISVRQSKLNPLVQAWNHTVRSPTRIQKVLDVARERKRIYRERGVQEWKNLAPMLTIPFWLVNTEAIRRVCGANGGLLSLITGSYREATQSDGEGAAIISDQTAAALSAASDGIQSAATALDTGVYYAPGELLCDIAARSDPLLLWPSLLAATMVTSFWPQGNEMKRLVFGLSTDLKLLPPSTRWRVRLSRAALLVGAVAPFTLCQLPVGLFWYWISSFWAGHALRWFAQLFTGSPEKAIRENKVVPCRNFEPMFLKMK
ncbi:hypothetical protein K456DRAFT_972107 [Colletotrichum gloeosporioides 23]|nr:hypothetical protein K456DRAFT_972107 [Colletotrichum gloeosporioides 23]